MVKLDSAIDRIELSDAGEIFEDPEGLLSFDDVRKLDGAGKLAGGSVLGVRSHSAFWLHYRIANSSSQVTSRWLEISERRWRELDLFVSNSDGTFQHQRATAEQTFSERPLPTAKYVFALNLAPLGATDIYLRAKTVGLAALSLTPELWNPVAYQKNAALARDQWLVYMGLAGALFLLNFLLWVSTREGTYLYYLASLLSIIWAVGSVNGGTGYSFEYLWPNFPKFEVLSWILSILVSVVAATVFIIHFVNMRVTSPWLYKAAPYGYAILLIAYGYRILIVSLDISYSPTLAMLSNRIGAVFNAVFVLTVLTLVVRLAIKGDRSARYIATAWTPLVVLSVASNLSAVLAKGVLTTAFMWGSAFELVMMSWALADRFKRERVERERAQASEAQAQTALVDELKRSERELESKVQQRTLELAAEQKKTRELLSNMLPEPVIQELTETGKVKPAEHRSATILFTDLADFTQTTATMPADRMVGELNDIFAAFDDITREEGVEKIKTIGDAYMAVTGISSVQPDHAERCVRAALRMQAFMAQRNQDAAFKWKLRIGLHSGPVVSGVVGKHKYAFDIWGDAVNIASRMESSGEAGKVNVSAYTYDLVRNTFDCTYRGKISAKGKGEIDMYFVERIKSVEVVSTDQAA